MSFAKKNITSWDQHLDGIPMSSRTMWTNEVDNLAASVDLYKYLISWFTAGNDDDYASISQGIDIDLETSEFSYQNTSS